MRVIAPMVAKEKGFPLRRLPRRDQGVEEEAVLGEAILPTYQARIKEIEQLIRENHIVTLPTREMQFRLASEAETAAQPAPHMDVPRDRQYGEKGASCSPAHRSVERKGDRLRRFHFRRCGLDADRARGMSGHELQFALDSGKRSVDRARPVRLQFSER